MRREFRFARPLSFLLALPTASAMIELGGPAKSQCFPRWRAVDTGVNGDVFALIALDEDGPGGLRPSVFAGGAFTSAGVVPTSRIAKWDGSVWSAVGTGMDGDVLALAVFDGDGTGPNPPTLFAGGAFTLAGGVPAGGIAKWDGASWSPLGSGMDGPVRAIAGFDPDGAGPNPPLLIAGGSFTLAGGVAASNIAQWDGTAWSPLGSGTNGPVNALAVHDDDGPGIRPLSVFAGGNFTSAGGVTAYHVARWDGSGWASLHFGTNGTVRSLVAFDDDGAGPHLPALFAGGDFTFNPSSRIAKWNGTDWFSVGGIDGPVHALAVHDDDDDGIHRRKLYAGGLFSSAGTSTVYNVAEYDGANWLSLGYGTDATVHALTAFDDFAGGGIEPALYAGGAFTQEPASHVAAWTSCGSSIRQFCRGDGSGPPCPCGNLGKSQSGCDNSLGAGGAALVTLGTARLSNDTLQFVCGWMAPHSRAFLFQSSAVHAAQTYGDGLLCLTGNIQTLYIDIAGSSSIAFPPSGAPPVHVQSANFGNPIAPGSVRHYQVRYQDTVTAFCPPPAGNNWNVSSGLAIVWYP